MATYTSNYAWAKPEGGDPVDITVLNNNLDSQDSIVHNAYMQLAPVFSTSATYAVDDVVLYANNLYKCITAVTVAGDWDSTKWTQVKVSDIAGGGGGGTSDYSQLTNLPSVNGTTLLGNKTSADLGLQDAIQLTTMPTASATHAGKIVQFVGTTTASYTHGYYYECVNNGGTYSWTQLNVQPSSGGGSGHTIVNASGTSMTQRDALQFKGGLSVSDDSTNDRTVVSDEYELITWADWQTIVANHEENLHPNAIITGAPSADGNISVDLMTKLWENPNPSSSFSAQQVTLSSSDYDLLLIIANMEASNPQSICTMCQKGANGIVGISTGTSGFRFRSFVYVSDTKVNVGAGNKGGEDNNSCVPVAIYGIKTTASVKVSAIASDVNTSADKCMLSDGVTSVEDAIECTQTTAGNYRLRATVSAGGAVTYSWVAE